MVKFLATTINRRYLMGGLLKPVRGTCRLDGEDVASRRPATQSRIFFLADNFEKDEVGIPSKVSDQFWPAR